MPEFDFANDIKLVLDITSRVDERVKNIQAGQNEIQERLNRLMQENQVVSTRVSILESNKHNIKINELDNMLRDLQIKLVSVENTQKAFNELTDEIKDLETSLEREEISRTEFKNRIERLEEHKATWGVWIKDALGVIYQVVTAVVIGYILFRLGLPK